MKLRGDGFAIVVALAMLGAPLIAHARWTINPTVTIAASAADTRTQLVIEAVDFWNGRLSDLGSPLRLGPITPTSQDVPNDYLQQLSLAVLRRASHPDIPDRVRTIPGDIIVALSEGEFISFAASIGPPRRILVGIRGMSNGPLARPNVARNVIAHELGHALGLRHNSDPTTLMCGRPAPCRPQDYAASVERFFPLTEEDKKLLLQLYPASSD